MEYLRSLGATNNHARTVPINKPIEIQTWPKPAANIEPGSPIKTQALISDAPADNAATKPFILRPPKKKFFSPPNFLSLMKKNKPIAMTNVK